MEEETKPKTDAGLVISSITVREGEPNQSTDKSSGKKTKQKQGKQKEKKEKKPPVVSELKKRIIETSESFPEVETRTNPDTLTDYYIEITPASIQFSRKLFPLPKSKNYVARQTIYQWSYKSRANMLKRLLSLDYSPLFGDAKRTPVMITLTYPGDWQTVAPDGKASKRHITLLKKRYEREFGEPLIGVWKLEFQRRGAPHTHILSSIKMDLGLFQVWLSKAWAEIVAHPDPDEREKHLRAGTQVKAWPDYYKETPHSISHYFGKHSSANKSGVKEYQNRAPELWIKAGSIGRFWGYWGLTPATAQTLISKEDYIFMQRTMRRWHNSKRTFAKKKVMRSRSSNGVIYYRKATRKVLRLNNQGGFIAIPEGMAETLQLALKAHKGTDSQTSYQTPVSDHTRQVEPTSEVVPAVVPGTIYKKSLGAKITAVAKRFLSLVGKVRKAIMCSILRKRRNL